MVAFFSFPPSGLPAFVRSICAGPKAGGKALKESMDLDHGGRFPVAGGVNIWDILTGGDLLLV